MGASFVNCTEQRKRLACSGLVLVVTTPPLPPAPATTSQPRFSVPVFREFAVQSRAKWAPMPLPRQNSPCFNHKECARSTPRSSWQLDSHYRGSNPTTTTWCTCDRIPVLPSSKTIHHANTLRNYALRRKLLVSPLFLLFLLLLMLLLAGALLKLSETSSHAGGNTHASHEERRPERGHTI